MLVKEAPLQKVAAMNSPKGDLELTSRETLVSERVAAMPAKLSPAEAAAWGIAFGLLAAVIYTVTNSCLRAVKDVDLFWVQAIKAVPTAMAMFPWMLWQQRRGITIWPGWGSVVAIVLGGMCGQVLGNVSFQFSLGEIGVALAVPLTIGGMIVSAATLGRIFLREPVTFRVAGCLALLLLAIAVLSLGADDARKSVAGERASAWQLVLGVGAACFSGLGYSILNVLLRYKVSRGNSLPATLFIVATTGMVCLGSGTLARIGLSGIAATSAEDWQMMILAGVTNTVAFVLLTKSLQLISVVYVNAINATQATMAAVAGVLVFGEALSPFLMVGVILTIVSLVLMRTPRRDAAIAGATATGVVAAVGVRHGISAPIDTAIGVSDSSANASESSGSAAVAPTLPAEITPDQLAS